MVNLIVMDLQRLWRLSKKNNLSHILSCVFLTMLCSCNDTFTWDPQVITQTRLNQIQHFLTLMNEEGELPAAKGRLELHRLIYSKFFREINEYRLEIPYYEESRGFIDGWGRSLQLLKVKGFQNYSYGPDGIDDWGEGDDLTSKKTVVARVKGSYE